MPLKIRAGMQFLCWCLLFHFLALHGLCFGEAAALTSAGIHVTTAAKLMGHSNPMMTLRIYTQVRDDEAGLAGISLAKYIAS